MFPAAQKQLVRHRIRVDRAHVKPHRVPVVVSLSKVILIWFFLYTHVSKKVGDESDKYTSRLTSPMIALQEPAPGITPSLPWESSMSTGEPSFSMMKLYIIMSDTGTKSAKGRREGGTKEEGGVEGSDKDCKTYSILTSLLKS